MGDARQGRGLLMGHRPGLVLFLFQINVQTPIAQLGEGGAVYTMCMRPCHQHPDQETEQECGQNNSVLVKNNNDVQYNNKFWCKCVPNA